MPTPSIRQKARIASNINAEIRFQKFAFCILNDIWWFPCIIEAVLIQFLHIIRFLRPFSLYIKGSRKYNTTFFDKLQDFEEKTFKKFYILYNSGLGLTVLMMIIRGSMQVLGKGEHAANSGMSGLGHIILRNGLFFFFQSLLSAVKKAEVIEQ